MIEIKELVIRATIDTQAEKPRDSDNLIDSGKPEGDPFVYEIVEQLIEDLKNRDER